MNSFRGNFEDASAKEAEKESDALSVIKPMVRHNNVKDINSEMFDKENDRYKLAMDMGLKGQAIHSTKDVYKDDTNKIADENNYPKVSDSGLEKLFAIPMLKRKALINNIQIFATSKIKYCFLMCITSFLSWWWMSTVIGQEPTFLGVAWVIANLSFTVACFFSFYLVDQVNGYEWKFVSISLKKENIDQTNIKIPYGALLKMKEAKEANIFSGFNIYYPQVEMKTVQFTRPASDDPAICGNLENGEKCLICYWDIPKDIDKAEARIKELRGKKIDSV